MDFGSGPVTKFDYGRFLIASLAWLSQQQGDRVGLVTFTGDIVDVVPPSTRHLQLLLHTLGRAKATGAGTLATPVAAAGAHDHARRHHRARHRLLRVARGARPRASMRSACAATIVIVFHLVDAAERDFPFSAAATFEDAEAKTRCRSGPDDLRKSYQEQVARASRGGGQAARRASGADYVRVDTDQPLDRALHAYLDRRLARSRVR